MKKRYFELINGLTDKDLLFHLYMTQVILCVVSLLLGFILFDHLSYLENIIFNDSQIFVIGIPAGLIVVIIDILLMKILPSSFYDDGGLNERIFKNRTIFHILIIAFLSRLARSCCLEGLFKQKWD
jgi:hypothetical protein